MAQQSGAHDEMDITGQKETFHGFLVVTVWMCIHIAQAVAMATLALAIGDGWWAGWLVFVVIGVAAGLMFRLGGVYWAVQVLLWVLLALGGLIVPAIVGSGGAG